jgi:hypothetical protein
MASIWIIYYIKNTMNSKLFKYNGNGWVSQDDEKQLNTEEFQLVLCFGGKNRFPNVDAFGQLKSLFINADIALCSTAGEIFQETVLDDSLIAVALKFETITIKTSSVNINEYEDSYNAAIGLIDKLPKQDLSYIMVFSDGSLVNGSELTKGLGKAAGNILVTGGLAGDDANFKSTLVGLNQNPTEGNIIAIGFYGDKLVVTHGSQGGWDMFGLERTVTKSEANVLYEINGESALDLYKKYLGPDVENLPASALLFPLALTIPGLSEPIVRTILSIDEEKKSMTFAGDIPEGSQVRLMKANFDNLIEASSNAAENSLLKNQEPDFAMLISCVGRKLILGPRTEEEVEAVSEAFSSHTTIAGFYSYGEISPFTNSGTCQLHNQTMTITSFYEFP